jgi:AcrR family transcriptional regulator
MTLKTACRCSRSSLNSIPMRVSRPRTGRRPGSSATREQIVLAARRQFAELGYERATFRSIAAEAGVDPALVVHFFGSKADLSRDVMALPPAVAAALASLADGPNETVGRRFAELVLGLLEDPIARNVPLGRIRCATTHPEAAALVRETVTRDITALANALGADRPDLRAVLIGAHVVGVALARYVVVVEPLASLPAAQVVDQLAPIFQRLLVDELP